jgi:hypothetical protein
MSQSTLLRLANVMARRWSPAHLLFPGLLAAVLMSIPTQIKAQQLTGTLSGTTYDQSGAIVPNANVKLKNEGSGDTRESVSNSQGYFNFAAVQPGTFTITISAAGFKSWEEKGIALTQGASLTIPNISLEVGATSQNIEVVASAETVVPTDTGEVATTLNSTLVNELPLQGRDAGELIRIMPGMAFNNGLGQGSSFTDRVVSSNSGPVGAYSSNGTQPNGAMSYMLDGANLVDPGNQGTQIANINGDMTSEIKVLMSGYDAAYAKGPVVFQAFGKSGTAQIHGEGYFYARNNVLNAEDAFQKSQGVAKADAYEYYPGGNIGGPVVLPFTKFNRNHDKLFFWVGYEYMRQQPSGTLWQTFVPTSDMLAGNFSQAALNKLPGTVSSHYGNITAVPKGFTGGIISPTMFDPTSLALLKTYPKPNADPATSNGNNFDYLDQSPQNRWELTEKVDYAFSEKTKLTVSYAYQKETDLHPVQVWWAPAFSLPYPSPLVAPTTSNVVMANLTHVFGPTLTNETVFTYARYINPVTPVNPTAINPATYGLSTTGLFGVKEVQIPNIISWSGNGGFAGYDQQAVFGGNFNGGSFGGLKSDPAIYDNVSKVAGTHDMKFGFYWDSNGNQQSSGNQLNGTYDFETYGGTTTGNLYADFLLGRASGYNQANAIPVDNLKYHQYSFYGQDSWKATKRLTLNYGIRFDHEGQWYPDTKYGAAVFNFGAFAADTTAVNAGLQWHSINPKIPISGLKSPLFYYEPRLAAAYDLFGNGKTVLRGGFAVFRYQLAYNLTSGPSELPLGVINYGSGSLSSLSSIYSLKDVPTSSGNAACGNGCSVSALDMGDGKTPYTEDYNVSISQALPKQMTFEVSYVGNRSRDLLIAGTNSDFYDFNMVPLGAFFKPDPVTGKLNKINSISNTNDYRPFQSYGDVWLSGHGSYANYNSLQANLHKQAGPVVFVLNYTFSKVMGIRENYSGNGGSDGSTVNPFNIKDNYGVLAYNHTQIFNAAYFWRLPSPIHSNFLLKGVVNGWQLSGVTQIQTGAPIQPNTNGNLNTYFGNTTVNGVSTQASPTSYLGSNAAGLVLEPLLTCNPGSNLKSGQYFNPSCFAPPAPGQNGTLMWPNIHGPAYFDSDLTLSKKFSITEHQSVEFRGSAFNFFNHPNPQFGLGGNSDITLNFSDKNNNLTGTNQNASTTGTPLHRVGDRLVEFAVKYYF